MPGTNKVVVVVVVVVVVESCSKLSANKCNPYLLSPIQFPVYLVSGVCQLN